MYIVDPITPKCSKCGSFQSQVLITDMVDRQITTRRCTNCGHEKVISETTWNQTEANGYIYSKIDTTYKNEF